ncbi:MAG: response regulator [Pseudodesulfovibrio sp.]|uniref:Response regulator receiver n=1 Tax=Pseudodesulfovibrio aespoeensis (strain ATCC 700646 / DSM 10631 / Aspo-2) TaxID=643562 RepID=E6VV33_PSEA9|nr:response regulator [Pseudodesulfovibrio aespoeensis]ADU61184.1 response regulator receiver [Pseudodesulfovibrio aespoeensis Aspo-2]MBU4192748.1 response regulator [Pseudomonadota bacterium]MBV1766353.1 response regulator [Pseudodesulfovibrio sp.]MBU4244852.1 response regulator [Pseudomonadota bacterium]MBU4379402.1 response regulator [Pseudomonadota bacterium]
MRDKTVKETILVIDDERPTLKMFTLLLSALNYEVITAENGLEGLNLFKEHHPPLVLTDIKMPVMDGIEVLKEIKKINPMAEVVVITGHGDMDLAIQALNLDATDFINKPLRREALELALSRAGERLAIAKSEMEQIGLEERGDAVIIRVRGNITGNTVPHLAERLAEARRLGRRVILMDFDENSSINGAGITGLTTLLRQCRDADVRVILAGLSDNFRAVFESVGITRLAELFDSQADALDTPGSRSA